MTYILNMKSCYVKTKKVTSAKLCSPFVTFVVLKKKSLLDLPSVTLLTLSLLKFVVFIRCISNAFGGTPRSIKCDCISQNEGVVKQK